MISQVNTGFYNALKLWPETWAANTTYTLGEIVKPTTYASHSYKCTTAGISHATTEPTWSTINGATQTDGTVTWTCYDTKTYQIKSPQGSTFPYVTFGEETDVPIGTFASPMQMESLTFWVNCFSDKSTADVTEIADEIMAALDNATLSVTNYTPMKCIREFIGSIIYDMETGVFQLPLRYRIWIDKS